MHQIKDGTRRIAQHPAEILHDAGVFPPARCIKREAAKRFAPPAPSNVSLPLFLINRRPRERDLQVGLAGVARAPAAKV